MSDLNPQQIAAVNAPGPDVSVVAGPGSGKTHTTGQRILSREIVTAADRVVVISFTNAGANEIARRLAAKGFYPRFVGTLHRFCAKLLGRWGHKLGYREHRPITYVTEQQQEELLIRTAEALRIKISWKKLKAKDPAGRLVWAEYSHTLKRSNMMDFDTMLEAGAKLLVIPEVRAEWEGCELYVDEAQDSGAEDWVIYRRFPASVWFIVGDPDQSVYSFRGARPDIMVEHHGVADNRIPLDLNYRSAVRICEMANKLIGHNTNRIPKNIRPVTNQPGGCVLMVGDDAVDEATRVALHLRSLMSVDGIQVSAREVAVLCRTNGMVAEVSKLMRGLGLPVRTIELPERPPQWLQAVTLLALLVDPQNDLQAEFWIRMQRPQDVDRLKNEAVIAGKALAHHAGLLEHFDDQLPLQFLARNGIGPETCRWIEDRIDGPMVVNVLLEACHAAPEATHEGNQDGITISTVHAAKGREWDVVAVMGLEEGLFPLQRKDTDLEEERRLCFVAVTRARHTLLLSRAKRRRPSWPGPDLCPEPSRFLAEMML